jgi:hypothetical protein
MSNIASTTQGKIRADKVTYDNSTSGLTATNAQAAIDELSLEQFSHSGVDKNLTIQLKRQMIVYQEIEIELGMELNILGELVLI